MITKLIRVPACAAVAAASLVMAGCSTDTTATSGAQPSAKEALTQPGHPVSPPASSTTAEPSITPSPADDAPFIEAVKYELRQRTVKLAGTPGQTTAACDQASVAETKGSTVTCTVTYEGIPVVWPVTIGGPALGGLGIGYKAEPSTGILTAKGAEADFWANQHRDGKDLRCDDMPALKAVPLGKTGYRCSYETTSVTDGKPMRVPMYLIVRDDGPHFAV
ncbi:hypothetical protein AB0919_23480 [Streptomyces sp. NPDC046994]|uniref:hypothetical protein n=1 Tax=Streptomyces sp. NPDC046994 TaxID=3155735 RepID=UPI003455924A